MNDLTELSNLFDVKYGVNLELNKLEQCSINDIDSIKFVSRTEKNNGVSAIVKKISGIVPNPPYTLSVAGGGSVLATFLQTEPYYSGRDLYVLTPKSSMTTSELLYYAKCINKNKYRYNYGRQANRTLKSIKVPKCVPSWVNEIELNITENITESIIDEKIHLYTRNWYWFRYDELFILKKGERILNKDMREGETPCIRPIESNNGVYDFIDLQPNHEGNTITVNYNGSVAEAFYQPIPYFALDDVNVLYPKFNLNPFIAMFLTTLIRKEKFRFNYGRKWHLGRMKESTIKLPVTPEGKPDWEFMENYIKSLPYSKGLSQSKPLQLSLSV